MPTIAVIIPAFRQPGLLVEAACDVLQQSLDCDLKVIVADDACPMLDTKLLSKAVALVDSRVMLCSRSRNGGLAANRNSAINFALKTIPDLYAVTFLDSDDRLDPGALQWFYDNLRNSSANNGCSSKPIGWVYTDPYQFGGLFGYLQKPSTYSPLWHLLANSNSATSLILADMLRAGCRFDEGMKRGSEDWDFWLQGVRAGYNGLYIAPPTFRYRRRPESMTSDAKMFSDDIRSYVIQKNFDLYAEHFIQRIALRDAERYAMIKGGRQTPEVDLSYFNNAGLRQYSLDNFMQLIRPENVQETIFRPEILLVEDPRWSDVRAYMALRDNIFLKAERLLQTHAVVQVCLGEVKSATAPFWSISSGVVPAAQIIADAKACIATFVSREKLSSLRSTNEKASVATWTLDHRLLSEGYLKKGTGTNGNSAILQLLFEAAFRHKLFRRYALNYNAKWMPHGVSSKNLVNFLAEADCISPSYIDRSQVIVALGSHDTPTLLAQLQELVPRFFLTAIKSDADLTLSQYEELLKVFDRIVSLGASELGYNTKDSHYLGSPINQWMLHGNDRSVNGVMLGAELLLIAGLQPLLRSAFFRRKKGAEAWMLLTTPTLGSEAAMKEIDAALAYEHTLDQIFVRDSLEARYAVGRGIPREKISLQRDLGRALCRLDHMNRARGTARIEKA